MSGRRMMAAALAAITVAALGAGSPERALAAAKPGAASKHGAASRPNLCKVDEEIITLCHPKGMTFALCALNGSDKSYVVYREQRGGGPVTQFPDDPSRYRDEFRFSNIGASGFETRIRFKRDGADHYIVDAMSKGAPDFDKSGWPVNATALIVRRGGRTQQFNCPWSDQASIRHLGYEMIPEETFDQSIP